MEYMYTYSTHTYMQNYTDTIIYVQIETYINLNAHKNINRINTQRHTHANIHAYIDVDIDIDTDIDTDTDTLREKYIYILYCMILEKCVHTYIYIITYIGV